MTNERILIVEDESLVADSIVNMVERLGYAVAGVAFTAQQAIEQTRDTHPDLVLMDIGLPGEVDGVAAAQEVRTRFGTPVVYLTAYSDEVTLQRAKIAQPFGYVLKPFQIRELHGAIEMALYRREMEEKLKASEARRTRRQPGTRMGNRSVQTHRRLYFRRNIGKRRMGWSGSSR
jgi:DNA-binding response OmpR family regulator